MRETGLIEGTLVATPDGWRPVEGLVAGDMISTFDHGMRPVRRVRRVRRGPLCESDCELPPAFRPLKVPELAVGNATDITLLPGQNILVESDMAEARMGHPFMLVPAAVLDGIGRIRRAEVAAPVEVVTLIFDRDELVYVNGSALAHCPVADDEGILPLDELGQGYTVLNGGIAREVAEDAVGLAREDLLFA